MASEKLPCRCEDCGLRYPAGLAGIPVTSRPYTCDDCGGYVMDEKETAEMTDTTGRTTPAGITDFFRMYGGRRPKRLGDTFYLTGVQGEIAARLVMHGNYRGIRVTAQRQDDGRYTVTAHR